MEKEQSLFDTLSSINVNGHTEKKGGLTYLSWAWAWGEFRKVCPNATYEVHKDQNGNPFFKTEEGYMVWTTVKPNAPWEEGALDMWLPVMDHRNAAVKEADAMQINKTVMRCLVKNISMFGLGLYIYAGEDLPEEDKVNPENMRKALSMEIDMRKLATYNKVDESQITDEMVVKAIEMKEKAKAKNTAKGFPTDETIVLAKTKGYDIGMIAKELGVDDLSLTDEMARKFIKEKENGIR